MSHPVPSKTIPSYPVPPKLTALLSKMTKEELVAQILWMYQMLREQANPLKPTEVCFYCGDPTATKPYLEKESDPPRVQPPACALCYQMGLYDSIPVSECPPELLERAKNLGKKT